MRKILFALFKTIATLAAFAFMVWVSYNYTDVVAPIATVLSIAFVFICLFMIFYTTKNQPK